VPRWFQTLTLEHQSWFQNVPVKCTTCTATARALLELLELYPGEVPDVDIAINGGAARVDSP
jgi:hypothetical protein